MKFTSIIVEDLIVAAEYLKHSCEKSGKIEVKEHFITIKDAIAYLMENKVDIIFLDVEMQDENGFDVLDQLIYSPQVILTTSKTEYAYNAFERNVTDFLKKPFTYQRFQIAMEKAIAAIEAAGIKQEDQEDHIFIKSDGKLIRLLNNDILYVESMGDYVRFVTTDKKYICHNTIKGLEEKMNASTFMKVHRSFIVNITKVANIRDNILYISNSEIPISKANRPDVMKRINLV